VYQFIESCVVCHKFVIHVDCVNTLVRWFDCSPRVLSMQEKCHQYWPTERSARYQYYVVDPMAEYNMPQYILREFKVTDARVSCVQALCKILFDDDRHLENRHIAIFQ